ncbi:hypothetical protein IFM89_001575 [Coptis chinensis]|uniref:Uncharacterized protein n=1 Tax=Coptis chinensis TaxID=261450 RepID=A0A835I183_9MAGN|nr:hypothetical protein IFM89_001575 [Coptis chinensis]
MGQSELIHIALAFAVKAASTPESCVLGKKELMQGLRKVDICLQNDHGQVVDDMNGNSDVCQVPQAMKSHYGLPPNSNNQGVYHPMVGSLSMPMTPYPQTMQQLIIPTTHQAMVWPTMEVENSQPSQGLLNLLNEQYDVPQPSWRPIR